MTKKKVATCGGDIKKINFPSTVFCPVSNNLSPAAFLIVHRARAKHRRRFKPPLIYLDTPFHLPPRPPFCACAVSSHFKT